MKNFKVEYPEKEPFNVVQNVFLNADRKVPLKFTNVWTIRCLQSAYTMRNITIIILLIYSMFQRTIYAIIPVTSMTCFFTSVLYT